MNVIADRFVIRPHWFITGAWFITDRRPVHRLADTADWTTAPLSIVRKVAREVAADRTSLSDLIACANDRGRRYERLRWKRSVTLARRREYDAWAAAC